MRAYADERAVRTRMFAFRVKVLGPADKVIRVDSRSRLPSDSLLRLKMRASIYLHDLDACKPARGAYFAPLHTDIPGAHWHGRPRPSRRVTLARALALPRPNRRPGSFRARFSVLHI